MSDVLYVRDQRMPLAGLKHRHCQLCHTNYRTVYCATESCARVAIACAVPEHYAACMYYFYLVAEPEDMGF